MSSGNAIAEDTGDSLGSNTADAIEAPSDTNATGMPAASGLANQNDPNDSAASAKSRSRYLAVIAFVLCAYAAGMAATVIVPIVIAILVALMLSPAVRRLEEWHIPRMLGTTFVLGLAIALLLGVAMGLSTPARKWLERMPRALDRIEASLRDLRKPLKVATKASEQIQKLTATGGARKPVQVVRSDSEPVSRLLNAAPEAAISFIATLFLTFLLLLHGDDLLRKFVTFTPHLHAKRGLVTATRHAQRELSNYVLTITVINAGLGTATAVALWFLDVPDPWLWGGIVALLNYAPYVGPALSAIALTVVGFYQTAQPLHALALPGVFLGLHLLEGQLLTPHLVGRRLKLDPVVVFMSLLLFGWLWGVAGMLLAVPLLTCAKIIAERVPQLETLARLLSY